MRMNLKELIVVLILTVIIGLVGFFTGMNKGRCQLVEEIKAGGWDIMSNTVIKVEYNLWPTSRLTDIQKGKK